MVEGLMKQFENTSVEKGEKIKKNSENVCEMTNSLELSHG